MVIQLVTWCLTNTSYCIVVASVLGFVSNDIASGDCGDIVVVAAAVAGNVDDTDEEMTTTIKMMMTVVLLSTNCDRISILIRFTN